MNMLDPIGWAIVLLVLGCGLLVLEVFIPSGGLLGFFAFVAIVGSMVMAFRRDTTTGLSFMAVAVFAVPVVIGLAFKILAQDADGQGDPRRAADRRRAEARGAAPHPGGPRRAWPSR